MAEKKYIINNAELMAEWDWEKNNQLDLLPNELATGSGKKVWWKCALGHEWQAIIANRVNRKGCPYCAGQKVWKGDNDLATVNPNLAQEWHPDRNVPLTPQDVTANSGQKVWWQCSNEHEWQAPIDRRSQGKGCPYCSGRNAIKGENDLQTINPTLAKEWNYEKNNGLTPMDVLPNSNKKVWWKCSKGHEWQVTINSRNNGGGCPYCSGRYAVRGENDLQTVNPTLAKEWNYEKNNGLTPMDVLPNSNKKVWWKCSEGHEWQTKISNRNNGSGCPYCSGRYAVRGENDLQTVNPTLAKEWNYEKNNGLTPMDVLTNSNKKVWWKCNKGHEWQSTISNRNSGNGCPVCNSERKTSFPEYALTYYLKRSGLDVIHSYRAKGYELDIYIPSLRIAIEYDGYYWHKNRIRKDIEKNYKCKKDGIKLYRLREALPPLNDSSKDYIVQENQKNLSKVLEAILCEITGDCITVDMETDAVAIENLRVFTEKENSLFFSNPEITGEWHYAKNGVLKPEHFVPNSHRKVWWKCQKGHEWQASIANRNKGRGCPYCSGKKVLPGYNDLQTVNPALAKEWNYEKNAGVRPIDVTPNSNKKAWWICSNGHEWEAKINNRNNGNGCPLCRRIKN